MGDAMRAAGVGPQVSFGDQELTFAPFSPLLYGRFEAYLERRAWESVYRQEIWMPRAKYKELEKATRIDIAADVYAYGGEAFAKASVSMPGLKKALSLSLAEGTPSVAGDAERIVEEFTKAKKDQAESILVSIGWLISDAASDDESDGEVMDDGSTQ